MNYFMQIPKKQNLELTANESGSEGGGIHELNLYATDIYESTVFKCIRIAYQRKVAVKWQIIQWTGIAFYFEE